MRRFIVVFSAEHEDYVVYDAEAEVVIHTFEDRRAAVALALRLNLTDSGA